MEELISHQVPGSGMESVGRRLTQLNRLSKGLLVSSIRATGYKKTGVSQKSQDRQTSQNPGCESKYQGNSV